MTIFSPLICGFSHRSRQELFVSHCLAGQKLRQSGATWNRTPLTEPFQPGEVLCHLSSSFWEHMLFCAAPHSQRGCSYIQCFLGRRAWDLLLLPQGRAPLFSTSDTRRPRCCLAGGGHVCTVLCHYFLPAPCRSLVPARPCRLSPTWDQSARWDYRMPT